MTQAFALTEADQRKLVGIHPDLLKVIHRAASFSPMPFMIIEGLRTEKRQRLLVAQGASKTMNSRHLTGHAVDIAPLDGRKPSWAWPLYHRLAPIIKQAARLEGVPIEWGGDWWSFKDGPHWQLPVKRYPATNGTPPLPFIDLER